MKKQKNYRYPEFRMAVAPVVKFYPADRKVLKDFLAECRDGSR